MKEFSRMNSTHQIKFGKLITFLVLFFILPISLISRVSSTKSPRVLFVIRKPDTVGGAERHAVHCYKSLLERGYNAWLFLIDGTVTEQWFQEAGLSYAKFSNEEMLWAQVKKVAKKKRIDLIMLDSRDQIFFAHKIAKRYKVKLVYIEHATIPDMNGFVKLDGIITVNRTTFEIINNLSFYRNKVSYIPPFFEDEKFLHFTSDETKTVFFKRKIGLELEQSTPVIATVGNINFDDYLIHKNYPLLLNAFHDLIYKKKKVAHLMIAGFGIPQAVERLKNIISQLKIEPYVHFFGRVNNVPEFLYHCDMHVIASTEESFGIATVEAGLMKKPALGARGTGAESIIVDGKTGFLFKNNDVKDLSDHLEILIDNPDLGMQFGINASAHIMNTLSNRIKVEALHEFLQRCMKK